MSQDCHSKLDDEKNRTKDLLGLHLRGKHQEFTQLHHAPNLKQEGQLHKIILYLQFYWDSNIKLQSITFLAHSELFLSSLSIGLDS